MTNDCFYFDARTGKKLTYGEPHTFSMEIGTAFGLTIVPMALVAMLKGGAPTIACADVWQNLVPSSILPNPLVAALVLRSLKRELDAISQEKQAPCPGHNRLRDYDLN